MTSQEELTGSLLRHLYEAHSERPRGNARWVMGPEWLEEVQRLAGCRPQWDPRIAAGDPQAILILGIPVEVREDGGVPHLEPL